ncbi:MAG: DUF1501 domain-containing protein [Planctomycetota bacterium]|nr:DUF1501 domain-containing protein [Planctomycetota bacterium]
MLRIGEFKSRSCDGVSRRAFVQAGAALPLTAMLSSGQMAQAAARSRAKTVVFVWLWGAPSHLDTFDPKPDAPYNYKGPFSTIPTTLPGVRFTELVPKLAARTDKFALVRSNITHDGGHPGAGTYGFTGHREGRGVAIQPSWGSIISRHHGAGAGLPPYVMLAAGIPKDVVKIVDGYGGGDWGKAYDPFLIQCNDLGSINIPALKLVDGVTPNRIAHRRKLQSQLDQLKKKVTADTFGAWDTKAQQAFTLLTNNRALESLDLTQEETTTREQYGQTSFGQSLLLARRLAEAEVPFINVSWSEYVEAFGPNTDFGWDTHVKNFDLLPNRHCPVLDTAFSAFLDDMDSHGLMDQTLVVCMGEFGRTPRINNRASRDHWPQNYFSMWAGAGVRTGQVIGASDRKGERPVTRPIEPTGVGVTMLDALGIDSVARAELNVLADGEFIHELF